VQGSDDAPKARSPAPGFPGVFHMLVKIFLQVGETVVEFTKEARTKATLEKSIMAKYRNNVSIHRAWYEILQNGSQAPARVDHKKAQK